MRIEVTGSQIVLLLTLFFVCGMGVGMFVEAIRRNYRDARSHVHDWGRWERACTTCGYIEREPLELP